MKPQRICPGCNETFTPNRKRDKYCNKECSYRNKVYRIAPTITDICPTCHTKFTHPISKPRQYCSRRCAYIYRTMLPHKPKKRYKGDPVWLKAWRKRNPEKVQQYRRDAQPSKKAAKAKRRAVIQHSVGTHTAADIRQQYKTQRGCCYYCGENVGNNYHVDHVVPLSRGGSNGPENIVIACIGCNLTKGTKLPHEWPEGGRLL